MADIGVDTSSYPKPAAPVSMLDQVQKYQGIESNLNVIQAQKMQNAHTALTHMIEAMGSLGPNATKDQYAAVAQNAVRQGLVPQGQEQVFEERLRAAPDAPSFYKQFMTSALDAKSQIEQHIGSTANISEGANIYTGIQRPPLQGGQFVPTTRTPLQLPPTTPTVEPATLPTGEPNPNYGQKSYLGASGPAGPQPVGLPVARPAVVPPPVSGAVGPTIVRPMTPAEQVANRFPTRPIAELAPGEAGAKAEVGIGSGKSYAADLDRAKNFQADLYPAYRVLDILHEQGNQAFGVGKEGLNTLKNMIVSWFPNVDPKTIQSVAGFEEAKKQLVALARASGNTGTNDQLAAAFEANPNTKMSGATIENVLKSVISLRKMQNAQTLLFAKTGLPDSNYSKWISQNQNVLDPRAFGLDVMSDEAKKKLITGMAHKDNAGNWVANKGKEREFHKFEQSRIFAEDAGLIEPPGKAQ